MRHGSKMLSKSPYELNIRTIVYLMMILLIHILICHTIYYTYQIQPIISLHGDIISNIIVPNSLLSSFGSRLCPGQLQIITRSTETQGHSLVSGLDLDIEIDAQNLQIITSPNNSTPR